jgi:hypothetical protein
VTEPYVPEDFGGTWGCGNLLEALRNQKYEEHDSMEERLGWLLDVEQFDRHRVNKYLKKYLKKLRWPRVTEGQLRRVILSREAYQEQLDSFGVRRQRRRFGWVGLCFGGANHCGLTSRTHRTCVRYGAAPAVWTCA